MVAMRAAAISLDLLLYYVFQFVILPFNRNLKVAQPELCFDLRPDFLGLKRLGDVIDTPGFESREFVLHFVQRAQENHRNRRESGVGAQPPAEFEAVHLGHRDVQQDQVRGSLRGGRKGQPRSRERPHAVPLPAQGVFHQPQVHRLVVDDHDVSPGLFFWCHRPVTNGSGISMAKLCLRTGRL